MKKITRCLLMVLLLITGCQYDKENHLAIHSQPTIKEQPIDYQVIISRTTVVDMRKESGESNPQTMMEKMTADISLRPVRQMADRTAFQILCNAFEMQRRDFAGIPTDADLLRKLQGESFTVLVSDKGEVLEASSLQKLMKKAAQDSLKKTCKGGHKEPDMGVDFYNAVMAICRTAACREDQQGQQYVYYQSTPSPAVEFSLPARQITAAVQETANQQGAKKVTIKEIHTMAEDKLTDRMDIYPEGVKTDGLFSILRRWRTQSIEGTGEAVVNPETGLCESLKQQWQVKATAGYAIPIRDAQPEVRIEETVLVQRRDIQTAQLNQ